MADHDVRRLKLAVQTIADEEGVSIGALANYLAFRLDNEQGVNVVGYSSQSTGIG